MKISGPPSSLIRVFGEPALIEPAARSSYPVG